MSTLASGLKDGHGKATVLIVDDDASIQQALSSLFRSVGLCVRLFGSAPDMLQRELPAGPSCLVLDIRLPGLSGLELQAKLIEKQSPIPIVIMTGHGDIPMSVRALKAGAVDFLTKPFRDQDMLDAVERALDLDRRRRDEDQVIAEILSNHDRLTRREKDVLDLVTKGLMNKQIAGNLGLSEITVKIHRGHVMKKMSAHSLADLVRMSEALQRHASKRAN